MVEDVPPGATVVGNPGHPVRVEGRKVEGPDADWIHLPDPIAEAIKALSERIGELEQRLAELDGGEAAEARRTGAAADARAAPRPAAEARPARPESLGWLELAPMLDGAETSSRSGRPTEPGARPGRAPARRAERAPARGRRLR